VSTITSDPPPPDRPTVFISYSHEDKRRLKELRTMLAPLVGNEVIDVWWDGEIRPSQAWREEIDRALAATRIGVLLVSPSFLASDFIAQKELPYLVEAARQRKVTLFWVLWSQCLHEKTILKEIQAAHEIARPLDSLRRPERAAVLTEICRKIADAAGMPASLRDLGDGGGRGSGVETPGSTPVSLRDFAPRLDIGRLPVAGRLLIGRETELARLDAAWDRSETHVLTQVAFGGTGKSALVSHWLDRMSAAGWRGARRVLDWSFYSQGTEDRVTSADRFLDHALAWFNDHDPKAGAPRDRGLRLAELIRQEKTLLVLDGVEPLQHPPTHPLAGRLKDPGLAALLKSLAGGNPGLCVVTTRERIADLDGFTTTAPQEDLEALSPVAGAELLRKLGVQGKDSELRAASEEFGNHALTLSLLGSYLSRACEGDIRQRKEVDLIGADQRKGGHALQVIGTYANWLGEGPELAILRLLGLFDRPAGLRVLTALRAKPAILGLTEPLTDLREKDWQLAISNLREQGLLLPADPYQLGTLDAHPLIRVFFQEDLKKNRSEAWRAGNLRLYEHLKKEAPDLPDTLAAMEPLFTAVVHGCRAGRQQEALDEVYWRRIQRGEEFYSTNKLGAFGADFSALSGFFDSNWDQPSGQVVFTDQAFLLNAAGFRLRALGRLTEAIKPLQGGMERRILLNDWRNAAISASNLSELTLTLGEVTRAVAFGRQSVELADCGTDSFQRTVRRTALADALHQAGRWEESVAIFREAEVLQPEGSRLCSLPGYRYCDLLLSLGLPEHGSTPGEFAADPELVRRYRKACLEVRGRAEETILIAERNSWLLDIALDHLSLGRAFLGLALTASGLAEVGLAKAEEHLAHAVKGLLQAGREDITPQGLLSLATLLRFRGDLPGAEANLSDALEIAERGPMRLHECDAHLEWARLCRQRGDRDGQQEHVARARRLVEETGYGRRGREVRWLEGL
jgi:tetratricopeptide (TPR) repeat protein